MSYFSTPPFFYAFNSSAQTVSVGNYFALSNYENVEAGAAGRVDVPFKAYVYGEIQTTVTASNNNYAVSMGNNALLTCKGYQCRNNNTVGAMDDGAYGFIEGAETGVLFANRYLAGSETSDANQTRVYGVFTS